MVQIIVTSNNDLEEDGEFIDAMAALSVFLVVSSVMISKLGGK